MFISCSIIKKNTHTAEKLSQKIVFNKKDSSGSSVIDLHAGKIYAIEKVTKSNAGYEKQTDEQIITWIVNGDSVVTKTTRHIVEKGSKQSHQILQEQHADSSNIHSTIEVNKSNQHIVDSGTAETEINKVVSNSFPWGVIALIGLLLSIVLGWFLWPTVKRFFI